MCQMCGCSSRPTLACPECGERAVMIDAEVRQLSRGILVPLKVTSEHREHHRRHRAERTHSGGHDEVLSQAREELTTRLRMLILDWAEHDSGHGGSCSTSAEHVVPGRCEHVRHHQKDVH